jgi:hypothetical protein
MASGRAAAWGEEEEEAPKAEEGEVVLNEIGI